MRYFSFSIVTLLLFTACSNDQSQQPANQTTSQPEPQSYQIAEQHRQTPKSISGDDSHRGPNPHAQLSSEQHIEVASRHAEEGRIEEALDVLARAIIASPGDASLIGTLGSLLLAQNRVAEAIEYLDEAVSLAPGSAILLVNRSQAYRKVNRSQEAMADLDKAVTLSPNLVPARFNRGVLLYDEARYKEALADFDVCVQAAPETAGPYFNRAVTRDALGDQVGAVSDMNKFIELADNPEWKKVALDTLADWQKDNN